MEDHAGQDDREKRPEAGLDVTEHEGEDGERATTHQDPDSGSKHLEPHEAANPLLDPGVFCHA